MFFKLQYFVLVFFLRLRSWKYASSLKIKIVCCISYFQRQSKYFFIYKRAVFNLQALYNAPIEMRSFASSFLCVFGFFFCVFVLWNMRFRSLKYACSFFSKNENDVNLAVASTVSWQCGSVCRRMRLWLNVIEDAFVNHKCKRLSWLLPKPVMNYRTWCFMCFPTNKERDKTLKTRTIQTNRVFLSVENAFKTFDGCNYGN